MCVFMSGPKNVIGDHVNVQLAAEVQQKEAAHKKKKRKKGVRRWQPGIEKDDSQNRGDCETLLPPHTGSVKERYKHVKFPPFDD